MTGRPLAERCLWEAISPHVGHWAVIGPPHDHAGVIRGLRITAEGAAVISFADGVTATIPALRSAATDPEGGPAR